MALPDIGAFGCDLGVSLLGFAGGWFLGHTAREIHEVKEAIVPTPEPGHCPTTKQRDPAKWVQSRIFGNVLVICAVITVAVSGYTLQNQRQIIDCQTRYNEASSYALSERVKATSADRAATRDMVSTIANLGSVPEAERRQAYETALAQFLAASKAADAQRMANPLPSPRCP